MNIFKKLSFASSNKEDALVELMNTYHANQKKLQKIETEYANYWMILLSIFFSCTLIPLFFMPYTVGIMYLGIFASLVKYSFWVKKMRKDNSDSLEHLLFFLKENEKEIINFFYKKTKTSELEQTFERIIMKCANNDYDHVLINDINNFIYKYQAYDQQLLKEERTNDLKKEYKIPLRGQLNDEMPVSIKEKYNEMC